MSLISSLPELLVIEIFYNWCELEVVKKFDAVCTLSKQNPDSLEIFSHPQFKLRTNEIQVYSTKAKMDIKNLRWVVFRFLPLEILYLDDEILTQEKYLFPMLNTRQLEAIDFATSNSFSERHFDWLFTLFLVKKLNQLTKLKKVHFSHVQTHWVKIFCSLDASIWKQLTDIRLSQELGRQDYSLRLPMVSKVLEFCSFLKVFYCDYNMNEQELNTLVQNNPLMEDLQIIGKHLTENCVYKIANSFKNLTRIAFLKIFALVNPLSYASSFVKKCPHITTIHFDISDSDMLLYTLWSPNAKSLTFSARGDLETRILPEAYAINFFNKVTNFNIMGMEQLTKLSNSTIDIFIRNNWETLNDITIHGFMCESYYCLEMVLRHCENLNSLQLVQCEAATDLDLQWLFQLPNKLNILHFSSHKTLTTNTLKMILEVNTLIRDVDLWGCTQVDETAIKLYVDELRSKERDLKFDMYVVVVPPNAGTYNSSFH